MTARDLSNIAKAEAMNEDELYDALLEAWGELEDFRSGLRQDLAKMIGEGHLFELQEEVADLRAQLERVTFERDVLKSNQIIAFGA